MGHDHRADCNGVFETEHVLITGLEPHQKLGLEVVVGGSR
jgi:hypothetical protein